jgi:exodeoxyribonuclease-3
MKIATFNANSIRSRIDIVLGWLEENQPDVLCVQETKAQDKDFPEAAFDGSGYEFAFKGMKAYNGVAIFSKSKISDVSFGLDDEPKDEPRLIRAKVNGVNIVNTYIPQGNAPDSEKFVYKLDWYKRLGEYFARNFTPDEPVIWLGDMNVALDERDVHSPERLLGHVCYCPAVWDAFKNVASWGFVDTFRKHCQEDGQYTFWDYRAKNTLETNRGWRLDYIMATKVLADKCTSCVVDREPRAMEKPSDHTFLVAEFDI